MLWSITNHRSFINWTLKLVLQVKLDYGCQNPKSNVMFHDSVTVAVVVNGNYNYHNYLKTSFIKLCYFDSYRFLIFIFWTVNLFSLQPQICYFININSHVTKLSCDWTDICPLILLGDNLTAFSYRFTVYAKYFYCLTVLELNFCTKLKYTFLYTKSINSVLLTWL